MLKCFGKEIFLELLGVDGCAKGLDWCLDFLGVEAFTKGVVDAFPSMTDVDIMRELSEGPSL